MPPEQPKEIFETIRYAIASSIPSSRAEQLRHVLDSNGATYLNQGLRDPSLTMVVTNSNRFEGWEDISQKQGVDVVTDKWVERSLILGKTQPPRYYSADPAMIFSGIVGCACELPSADLEVLSAGITALGGQWRGGLTKEVTHLFALSPGSTKYSTAMHYREETGVRVILPHWFDDAVRLGMGGLSTKPYEWPDPEILKGIDGLTSGKNNVKGKGKTLTRANVEHGDVKLNLYATAAIFTPDHGRSSPPSEADISLVLNNAPAARGAQASDIRSTQVWNGRKILLSRTLELYKGRREAVHIGIERAGGVVLRFNGDEDEPEDLEEEMQQGKVLSRNERVRRQNEAQRAEECDILVTRWRYGRAYIRACQAGKVIGTLSWLFHVQSIGILSNPQDQLLHYPVPKRLIDAFSNHVITVTNYTGEAREYIKKLIYAMGARFTPSMSGQNTVLIAAFIDGAKAAKAQSWSIPVVNHTWLEDCFIQWRNLTVALEKYIVFPPGVNFSALLGERGVGVGSNVSSGIDDLASTIFEEDEVLDEPSAVEGAGAAEQVMAVDMPQGTGESANEVATNLIDETERKLSKPVSKPQPKPPTKKHEKLIAPAGMDVEFEPPSTALIANQVDWNIDLNDDNRSQSIEQVDEHEVSNTTKGPAKSTSRAQFSTTRTTVKATNAIEESEEDEEMTMKIKQKKELKVNIDASQHLHGEEEDEETSVVISKKTAKYKGRKRKMNEVTDPDDTAHERTVPSRLKPLKFRPSELSDDGMDEDNEDRGVTRSKTAPTSKANAASPSGNTRSRTSTKKPTELVPATKSGKNSKVKPMSIRSETDKERDVRNKKLKPNISATVPKKRRSTSDHEEEEEPEINGLQEIPEELFGRICKGKRKGKEVEGNKRSHDNLGASTGKGKDGFLKLTKADARTRIKKKTSKADRISVESEDEEELEIQDRGGKEPGKKARAATVTTDEEKDTRPSRSKVQIATSKDKKGKAPSRPQPLRVYSSDDDVESEDGETVASAANRKPRNDDDGISESDDELPAVVHLSHRKTNAGSGDAAGTARVKSKGRTSNSSLKSELKASATPNKQQLTSTPKRTVSVLVPSLTISGGSKKNGGKTLDGKPGTRTDKSGSNLQPKLSFERTVKSKPKSRTLVPDSGDESEVEEVISPRARAAVSKDARFQTLAERSSLKDVVNPNKKGKDPEIGRTYPSSSITVSHKPSRTVLPELMEFGDDDVPGSTPGSTTSLGHPRRSAAAKASQKLHETVMPDLVNFEAQMKKSKGKGRQSGGLSAFALDIEKNREHDTKRKITSHQENDEDSGGEEEQPKKRRRISDENDRELSKPKSKGKQKAKNYDEEDASRTSDVVLLTTQVTLNDDVVKTLTKLGVRMTTRPSECTHLLAPHLVRTEKFLCSLACAPFILSAKWAAASAAAKKLLPEKEFILKDEAGEKKYGTDLSQALRRAKSNKGKLLEGKMFYVTPRVAIDKKLLKNVVNALGGQVTNQAPSIRIIGANPEMRYVISCKEDISIWRPIATQGYKVYNQELLLMGAMKQKMEWERPEFIVEA